MDGEVHGGNSSVVARIGDTVHRRPGVGAPAVHRLLRRLRSAGITEVPEPLGFDDVGREVLSFIPGEAGRYPPEAWVWDAAVLDDAAALLRRIHDASAPLVAEDLAWGGEPREPAEVICHNDVAPYNMAFDRGRLRGIFDFDTAAPGPRIWDLAHLAYRLAPLTGDAGPTAPPLADRLPRVDRILVAYGMDFSRRELLRAMIDRVEALARFTEVRAVETGDEMFHRHAAMYRRDRATIAGLL